MTKNKWLMPSELITLSLILLFFLCGILPAIWFAIFDDLPIIWLQEDGLYESLAVLALFVRKCYFLLWLFTILAIN